MASLQLSPDEKIVAWTDVRECAAFMNSVWKVPRWEYTPKYLSAYLDRPSAEPPYSIGCLCGEEMGGYICFLPYTISLNGSSARVAYGTWWSAKRKFVFRRIGAKLVFSAVNWARKQKLDAVISINEKDSTEEKAFERTVASMGLPFVTLHTFGQYAAAPKSVLRRSSACESGMFAEMVTPAHRGDVASLVCRRPSLRGLYRRYSEDEISFVFIDRPNTRSWICGDEKGPRGVVNIMVKEYRGDVLMKNAYLEHVQLDRLSREEFGYFLNRILRDEIFDGVTALIVPDTGAIPVDYIRAYGMWPTVRRYNLSIVPLITQCVLSPITDFRFDIF